MVSEHLVLHFFLVEKKAKGNPSSSRIPHRTVTLIPKSKSKEKGKRAKKLTGEGLVARRKSAPPPRGHAIPLDLDAHIFRGI
jgi:hypothetical protein